MADFAYDRQEISGQDGKPPLQPGRPLKFVVEDPGTGNQSSVWRIWTGKRADDIYLCETESGGEWKTSLHNDWGRWRVAMTAEAAERRGTRRVVLSEQERSSQDQHGWAEGTALLVPCSDLRPPALSVPASVIRIPTSPSHSGVGIRLLLQDPESKTFSKLEDAFGVGVLVRSNGATLYVVAQLTSLDRELAETLAVIRSDVRATSPEATRYVGILASDERRILVDMALA